MRICCVNRAVEDLKYGWNTENTTQGSICEILRDISCLAVKLLDSLAFWVDFRHQTWEAKADRR